MEQAAPGMTAPVFGRPDPDGRGYFGPYGGRFVPETLVEPIEQLERAYREARDDPAFSAELSDLLTHYVGRETPIYEAVRLTADAGGARVFLKREDLGHTGAHKINNALGQGLLAKRMGKRRVVAETGAGQHGVATATVCALMELECEVYMGTEDMRRQAPNVFRMQLLGATVTAVDSGSRTLKDAINEAMRDWVSNVSDTYYLLGSVLGPHPYPLMVREFQSVIGQEARRQILSMAGRLPDAVVACVGGGATRSVFLTPSLTTGRSVWSAWKLEAKHWCQGSMPRGLQLELLVCSKEREAISFRILTATSSSRTRFPPVSTMPPLDRNTRGSGTSVGQNTRPCLTMRRWPRSRPCADSREFSRRSNHRTQSLMPEPWPATWGATASSS